MVVSLASFALRLGWATPTSNKPEDHGETREETLHGWAPFTRLKRWAAPSSILQRRRQRVCQSPVEDRTPWRVDGDKRRGLAKMPTVRTLPAIAPGRLWQVVPAGKIENGCPSRRSPWREPPLAQPSDFPFSEKSFCRPCVCALSLSSPCVYRSTGRISMNAVLKSFFWPHGSSCFFPAGGRRSGEGEFRSNERESPGRGVKAEFRGERQSPRPEARKANFAAANGRSPGRGGEGEFVPAASAGSSAWRRTRSRPRRRRLHVPVFDRSLAVLDPSHAERLRWALSRFQPGNRLAQRSCSRVRLPILAPGPIRAPVRTRGWTPAPNPTPGPGARIRTHGPHPGPNPNPGPRARPQSEPVAASGSWSASEPGSQSDQNNISPGPCPNPNWEHGGTGQQREHGWNNYGNYGGTTAEERPGNLGGGLDNAPAAWGAGFASGVSAATPWSWGYWPQYNNPYCAAPVAVETRRSITRNRLCWRRPRPRSGQSASGSAGYRR